MKTLLGKYRISSEFAEGAIKKAEEQCIKHGINTKEADFTPREVMRMVWDVYVTAKDGSTS